MFVLAVTLEVDRLFIVYVVAAGRSITKYIRAPNQQKAKGTSSGVGGQGQKSDPFLHFSELGTFVLRHCLP